MNRRSFLAALAAAPIAAVAAVKAPFALPFQPHPAQVAFMAGRRFGKTAMVYARVRITPEMLASQDAFNRARSLELEALTRDLLRHEERLLIADGRR